MYDVTIYFNVTHGNSFFDKLIQVFTFSPWSHAALIVSCEGNIIELQTKGIQKNTITEYPVDNFYLVDVAMSDEERCHDMVYAEFMLKKHEKYGFLAIASIALKNITHSQLVIIVDGIGNSSLHRPDKAIQSQSLIHFLV